MSAIGYIRVSSEQQAGEKQTSLADQRAAITALATRLGVTVERWFEDAGFSGATIAKRPAMRALIAFCEQHRRSEAFVLVLNDSRFGRFDDPDEAAALRFRLKAHGWHVRFAEADDIQDPSLRHIMRAVGGAQASEYRRNLRAQTTRGRHGTVKQGYWASRAPFGYRRAVVYPESQARVLEPGVPKARGEKIKLVPDPAEAAIVRECFTRYASGAYSMHALRRWLNTVPAATLGRRPWAVSTVRGLLENYSYLGMIAARRRTAVRMDAGDFTRHAPEYVVEGTHEPLVAADVWQRCQARLREIPPISHVHDYRVRGLVRCADCGTWLMGGGLGSQKPDGTRRRFYLCQAGRDKQCAPRAACVTDTLLESTIIAAVSAHVAEQITPAHIAQQFRTRFAAIADAPRVDVEATRRALMARRERLIAAIESGALTIADATPRLDALRTELAAVADAPVSTRATLQHTLDRLVARGRDFMALAHHATGPELRALLAPWVDGMTFEKGSRAIVLRLRTLATCFAAAPLVVGDSHEQDTVTLVERRVAVGGRRA
jgi:DNA invertase Pin-like site-specific DNA recombinase